MDKSILPEISIFACHGCNPEEKNTPQPFRIAVKMFLDLTKPGRTDLLIDTIDYGSLYIRIKSLAETTSYNLIESLAERIAALVLDESLVERVIVVVEKTKARVGTECFHAQVEIERTRGDRV